MARKKLKDMLGQSQIEVEKDEIVETPDGQTKEITKGSHAKGTDTKMTVPTGTEIFSDKVKAEDGRTMKERKEARMERAAKRERILEKLTKSEEHYGKFDTPTVNTRKRKMQILLSDAVDDEVEEVQDVMTMQEISASKGSLAEPGETPEYQFGGVTGDPITWANSLKAMLQAMNEGKNFDINKIGVGDYASTKGLASTSGAPASSAGNPNGTSPLENDMVGGEPTYNVSGLDTALDLQDQNAMSPADQSRGGGFMNLIQTAAPFLGPAGTIVSAVSPLISTLMQRATDKKHRNQMLGVGQREIVENDITASALAGSRDRQLEGNEVNRATTDYNNRISARGQGLLRALSLASATGKNRADATVNQQFDDRFSDLRRQTGALRTGQELRTAQDNIRVRSENDADKDAFFTALSTSGQEVGRGMQQLGRMGNLDPDNPDNLMLELQNLVNLYKAKKK